jgi:hypothetical protein
VRSAGDHTVRAGAVHEEWSKWARMDRRRRRCDMTRRKSSSVHSLCEGSPQVIFRVGVTARKLRAPQAENRFRIRCRCAAQEQLGGDPQIGDAPIRMWKALRNPQTLQPGLIDCASDLGCESSLPNRIVGGESRLRSGTCRGKRRGGRSCSCKRDSAQCGLDQRMAVGGKANSGMANFDPGRPSARQDPLGFLIGEAGQSSQMAPVCAGPVSLIQVSQLPADIGGHRRFQRLSADLDPGLEMAWAGFNHHTGLVTLGPHGVQHGRIGAVQIHQNVAGVLLKRIGLEIHVITLAIPSAQKTYGATIQHLGSRPNPVPRQSFSGVTVNQTDEIKIARHRRELPPQSL